MTNLMYDSKTDIRVSRSDLAHVPTPAGLGARHRPYPFGDFANGVVESVQSHGFQVRREEFAITKDEQRLFGLLDVGPAPGSNLVVYGETDRAPVKPWNLIVGLRGSHDQKIARGIAIGSQVIVCSNLCFHGDLGNWNTRQTTNVGDRIPALIDDAISQLDRASTKLTVDFDRFNSTPISRERGDSLLVSMYRAGGFSASQLGRAIGEWGESSVEEHASNGRNFWWLFNAATEALKPTGANSNHGDTQHRSTVIFNHLQQAVNAPTMLQ